MAHDDYEQLHKDRDANLEPESRNSEVIVGSTTDSYTAVIERDSLPDGAKVEHQVIQRQYQDQNHLSVLPDHIVTQSASEVAEHCKILFPSSFSNTPAESDFDAAVSSACMPTSISYHSTDSGIYSKAVSDGLVTSLSAVTALLDVTTSTDDRSHVSEALDTKYINSSAKSASSELQCQMEYGSLPTNIAVVQSTCIDTDDQSTLIDVRSSVMSSNADDENVVSLGESAHTLTHSDEYVGLQGLSSLSDSDAEDDAVLKTVVAVHTKPVERTEFVDSIQLFEPNDIDKFSNNVVIVQSSMGEMHVRCKDDHLLHDDDLNVDSSLLECHSIQPASVNRGTVSSSQTENSSNSIKNSSIAMDNRNCVTLTKEVFVWTNEQLSTMSTELDQYMTKSATQVTDTSFDSHTGEASGDESHQLSDLVASVKISPEYEGLRVDSAGRRSHSRTRCFTNANSSLSSSRSSVPEMRRHSCTLDTQQPLDIVGQVSDAGLEHRGREVLQDDENVAPGISLTASIEDLKLRPSKKMLEFDALSGESSQLFYLEPPDEYRDQPVSTESVESFISPNVTDLCTDASRPLVDMNIQAKKDHVQRYLKSLATLPESARDVMDGGLLQYDRISSQDNSSDGRLDGEDAIDLPCQERSASLLVPDLLHQSDNMQELTDAEYLDLQMQHYEILRQDLMEEHRRSLERLLAKQEQELSLLKSQLLGQTSFSSISHRTDHVAHTPDASAAASNDYDRHKSKPLPDDVPSTVDGQSLVNEMPCPCHATVGLDLQNILSPERHVAALADDAKFTGHKKRSPAGVFYSEDKAISQGHSSTICSDDTESEFAYKSPAVLRNSRRLTPVCSPRDSSKTLVDQMHNSLMATEDSQLHSSDHDQSPMHSHRLNRRYVDVFSGASLLVIL